MLYKFKSQACADVIMRRANGEQMLSIVGKELTPQGIITVAQMPAAIAALQAAMVAHEAAQGRHDAHLPPEEDVAGDGILLRQRATPFIDLLRCSAEADKDVVWGV